MGADRAVWLLELLASPSLPLMSFLDMFLALFVSFLMLSALVLFSMAGGSSIGGASPASISVACCMVGSGKVGIFSGRRWWRGCLSSRGAFMYSVGSSLVF